MQLFIHYHPKQQKEEFKKAYLEFKEDMYQNLIQSEEKENKGLKSVHDENEHYRSE